VIGYGWDSHEFQRGHSVENWRVTCACARTGRPLDGDVLLHAITDALLEADRRTRHRFAVLASDPKWERSGLGGLLREALRRVRLAGYAIVNLDSTIIMAEPKIGPIGGLRARVAEMLNIPPGAIGIKPRPRRHG